MLNLVALQIVVVGESVDGLAGVNAIRNGRRGNASTAHNRATEGYMRVDCDRAFSRPLR